MIFLTAMTIGIAAAAMRSALTIALVAVLIGATFALAAVLSSGPVALSPLLIAIAGYNFGLLDLVVVLYFFQRQRTA